MTAHLFTVDVEDYFQVYALERFVDRSEWDQFPSRVAQNTDILLELLDRHKATGTFFTLGWVAQKHPAVVRRIVDAGHELASHGWWHRKITTQSRQEFFEDVYAARMTLEQTGGQPVVGYRAPSFSITPGFEWAFDALLEAGYRYDSSLFPIKRMNYGYPKTPPLPHIIHRDAGDLIEFPLATTQVGGLRLPAAGGGYLRQFPYGIIRRAFREHSAADMPAVFYIHPWEVDPGQPRFEVPLLTRVRHYRNLSKTAGLIDRLLAEFRFTSIARRLADEGKPILNAPSPSSVPLVRDDPVAIQA